MIPRSIKHNLSRLRRRERLVRFAWGAARWLAVVLALLLVCVLTDYLVDRDRDTPWALRYFFAGVQVAAAAIGAFFFLLWPQLRRLRDPELALWVESRTSRLEHRLITAVELNQPGAQIAGMSEELIAVVTREAEKLSVGIAFPRIADHRRLGWAVALVAPIALVVLLPVLVWPQLVLTLLARQALLDVEVPRLVRLESITPEVWPTGEKLQIVYRVHGPVDEDTVGEVVVSPVGQPRDRYELTYWQPGKDGETLFRVELPPSTADFEYVARVADGRTRKPGQVHFVARPVVSKQGAWMQLPAFCGTTPDGNRYEQPQQGHGDVVGIGGSRVRVWIAASKPIRGATLEILGPERFDPEKGEDEQEPEKIKSTVAMKIGATVNEADALFDLKPGELAYRIVVSDEYGFVNVPAPRRTLRLIPEEPPQVVMLKDYFGVDADSDVEGIPVPLGKPVRVPYVAHGPYGLGMAQVLYRVLPKLESGNDAVEPGPWTVLKLPEVTATKETGPFSPQRGVFQNSGVFDSVPFHAVPSYDPKTVLGRQLGGGRYLLQTTGLVDSKGKAIEVRKGDQIEYCVEVFADKDANAGRPSARSETRVTTVVDATDWRNWLKAVLREEEQLRKLDAEERALFGPR
jgi:hypothetical protein